MTGRCPTSATCSGGLTEGPIDPERLAQGLETAVALTDYWLGRHPAEGLSWIGQLLDAAGSEDLLDPRVRAAALLAQGHLAYWVTEFSLGASAVEQAQALFAELGDPARRRPRASPRGAIAAATDDLPRCPGLPRGVTCPPRGRGRGQGDRHDAAPPRLAAGRRGCRRRRRPALERAHQIAVVTGDPLANGHVLAALNLAHWKAGDLDASMLTGNEALLIFRELGHRPTEGTVASRLAAVARGLGRPRAARRYAELAIDAGEQSSTRTTIALGHINLARLDLDAGDPATAAEHLARALELIDPGADRWVLVDVLEAVARMLVGDPGGSRGRGRDGRHGRDAGGGSRTDPDRDPPADRAHGGRRSRVDGGSSRARRRCAADGPARCGQDAYGARRCAGPHRRRRARDPGNVARRPDGPIGHGRTRVMVTFSPRTSTVDSSPAPLPPNMMLAISVPSSAMPSRSTWIVYPSAGSVWR